MENCFFVTSQLDRIGGPAHVRTVAAIATARTRPGGGLRLSADAAQAAAHIFQPLGKTPLSEAPDRQLLYGRVFDQAGDLLDTGLAFVSRAPHSYTGEETAEIQCHGSPVVLSLGLDALCAAGARLARPGEFTQRAFLNGKLDLTQAEAVIDLIDAETPAAARQAAGQLNGALSRQIDGIYSALTDLMAHFCAVLDYPDEDIDFFPESNKWDRSSPGRKRRCKRSWPPAAGGRCSIRASPAF